MVPAYVLRTECGVDSATVLPSNNMKSGVTVSFPSRAAWLALSVCLGLTLCAASFAKDDAARLAALHTRVRAMAAETAYVEDITKIQRLGRAFGYYTDKGYFGEAAGYAGNDAAADSSKQRLELFVGDFPECFTEFSAIRTYHGSVLFHCCRAGSD